MPLVPLRGAPLHARADHGVDFPQEPAGKPAARLAVGGRVARGGSSPASARMARTMVTALAQDSLRSRIWPSQAQKSVTSSYCRHRRPRPAATIRAGGSTCSNTRASPLRVLPSNPRRAACIRSCAERFMLPKRDFGKPVRKGCFLTHSNRRRAGFPSSILSFFVTDISATNALKLAPFLPDPYRFALEGCATDKFCQDPSSSLSLYSQAPASQLSITC